MESAVTEALNHVLSLFGKEVYLSIVFMLENRYGIKVKDARSFDMVDLNKAFTDLFGESADILIHRMEEYIIQPAVAPKLG